MKIRIGWVACALALLPAASEAQTISGLAEWSIGKGSSASAGQSQANSSFWQGYTLGFSSPLFNPRFLTMSSEVSFRAGKLSFVGGENDQRGSQRDLGYKLGATLFPAGRFPFFIQASRDNVAESGDYPASNGIRGGIVVPPGEASPEFRTRNTSLAMGWQLAVPSLPHVDIGYRKGNAVVTGGPYRGEQQDEDLHVGVSKDTANTRQALRYQRNAYQSPMSQAFNQRIDDLDYELGATIAKTLRTSTRIGRRSHYSMFDVPSGSASLESDAYHAPTRGQANTVYAVTSISFEPSRRFAFDLTGSVDQQKSGGATTNAKVASGTARLEVIRGLSVSAVGTYGDRGQILGDVPTTVITRSGLAGATYRAGIRWLQGSVGYSAGIGANTTPEGRVGAMRSEAGQASLSVSIKNVGLSGGYERTRNRDDILDYGNLFIERGHAAIQSQLGRFQLSGTWEQSLIERGRAVTFSSNLQQSFSGSVSLRIGHDSLVTANGGGFRNQGSFGRERAVFAGAALESQLLKSLHLTAWIRRGDTTATLTRLDQSTLYGFGQLEYRLRQFSLALEYRHNEQHLRASDLVNPYQFRGHQLMLRISRKFGGRI
jgi:hypothetical protein